jgi:hypothetical protein
MLVLTLKTKQVSYSTATRGQQSNTMVRLALNKAYIFTAVVFWEARRVEVLKNTDVSDEPAASRILVNVTSDHSWLSVTTSM